MDVVGLPIAVEAWALRGLRVLIVEDRYVVAWAIKSLLEEIGWRASSRCSHKLRLLHCAKRSLVHHLPRTAIAYARLLRGCYACSRSRTWSNSSSLMP
jgi:hypothetical protein